MTIDINELRRLAQRKDQMDSLISRLQRPGYDLQKEQAIQEAIVVLQQLNAERDALRAKIAEMERQEPVAWTTKLALELGKDTFGFHIGVRNLWGDKGIPLYALPGAKENDNVATN